MSRSKRQTLSQRFDTLPPPKYENMTSNGTTFVARNDIVRRRRRQDRNSEFEDEQSIIRPSSFELKYSNGVRNRQRARTRNQNQTEHYDSPSNFQPRNDSFDDDDEDDDDDFYGGRRGSNYVRSNNFPYRGRARGRGGRNFNSNRNNGGNGGFRNNNNSNTTNNGSFGSGFRGNRGRGGGGRGRGRGRGRGGSFGGGPRPTKEQLDADIDKYVLGNPDIEGRNVAISSQLDADLDDYWNQKTGNESEEDNGAKDQTEENGKD